MTQQDAGTALPTPATPNGQAESKPEQSGTTIKPGVYTMRATDAELGYTAGTPEAPPAPQVALLMEFCDGEYKGLSLTWYGFFTDKTKAGTIRALRTVGWQGDDLTDLSSARGEAPCTVQIEADLQGVPRARIRFIGGGVIALKSVMNEDQKKAFAASMKAFASTIGVPEHNKEEEKKTGKAPKKFF